MNMNQSMLTPGKKWAGDIRPHGYKTGQLAQFTPEQMQLFQQGLQNVGPESFLGRLASGDQSQFAELEAPALQQFSGLLGGLSSRFSGMGGLGARKSSGFGLAGTQAASDFAQQLQSNRLNLRNQAIQNLHNMSQQLLGQRPYERFLTPKQDNPWARIVGQFGGAIPGLITSMFGGGSPQSALEGATSWLPGFGGGF